MALTPGVGELELSSVFETYGGQTLATRTVALSADGGPVVSRHGLVFVPRGAVGSVAVDRLLVPGADAAARRIPMPGGWRPSTRTHGPASRSTACSPTWPATWTSRPRGSRPSRWSTRSTSLALTGPSWPWALLLRVVALAAAGAALGIGLTRKLGRRRTALTPAGSCRTVTG